MIESNYESLFSYDGVKNHQMIILVSDGTVLTNENIVSESMVLDESLCSENTLKFGCCEASKFSIRLIGEDNLEGKIITVMLEIEQDNRETIYDGSVSNPITDENGEILYDSAFCVGVYKVFSDEPTADRDYHDIEAYDVMKDIIELDVTKWYDDLFANAYYFDHLEGNKVTVKDLRDSFFRYIGLKQLDTTLGCDNMFVSKNVDTSSNTVSGRDIVTSICELSATFGHISRGGYFEYKKLDDTRTSVKSYDRYINGTVAYKNYDVEDVTGISMNGLFYGDSSENVYCIDNILSKDLDYASLKTVAECYKHWRGAYISVETNSNPSYVWLYAEKGSNDYVVDKTVGNGKDVSIPYSKVYDGRRYKCKCSTFSRDIISSSVTIDYGYSTNKITLQPTDVSYEDGETVTFSTNCNDSSATYKWYYNSNSNETEWTEFSGGNTKQFSYSLGMSMHDKRVQCKVTCSNGEVLYTNSITLSMEGVGTDFYFTKQAKLTMVEESYSLSFKPFTIDTYGDMCVEVGDYVTIPTLDTTINSYIMKRSIRGIQSFRDSFNSILDKKLSTNSSEYYSSTNQIGNTNVVKLNSKGELVEGGVTADVSNAEPIKIKNDNLEFMSNGVLDLSNDNLSIVSDNFNVSKDGTMNCSSANFIGGSINIESNGENYDIIKLLYSKVYESGNEELQEGRFTPQQITFRESDDVNDTNFEYGTGSSIYLGSGMFNITQYTRKEGYHQRGEFVRIQPNGFDNSEFNTVVQFDKDILAYNNYIRYPLLNTVAFTKGTSFSLSGMIFNGFLTTSQKEIYFYIPLPKIIGGDVTSVSISGKFKCRVNGTYVVGSASAYATLQSKGTVTTTIAGGTETYDVVDYCKGNGVRVKLVMSSSTSATNNAPASIDCDTDAKITFN